ncbi:MAG: hypothetical protein WDN26_23335 [Chitinophagaceae bacterium]
MNSAKTYYSRGTAALCFYKRFFRAIFMMLALSALHQNLSAQLNTVIDLSTYVRVGKYDHREK